MANNLFCLVFSFTAVLTILISSSSLALTRFSTSPTTPRPSTLKKESNPPIPFYRYYDQSLGDHFYTTDITQIQREKPSYHFDKVLGKVWQYSKSGTVPLFRFYNEETLHHFYTTNLTDIGAKTKGAIFKGIAAFVYDKPQEDTLPMYRFYNEGTGDYFFTTNLNDFHIPAYSLQQIGAYIYPENYVEVSVDLDRLILEEIFDTRWRTAYQNLMTELSQKMALTDNFIDSNLTNFGKSLEILQKNPVPIGFIYVQISGQSEPSLIWPTVRWIQVSSEYAGLFFRVVGGASAEFGRVQHENAPRIIQAETQNSFKVFNGKIDLPIGGTSDFLYSSQFGTGNKYEGTRYTTSGGEVRPENQAVKLWKRIG